MRSCILIMLVGTTVGVQTAPRASNGKPDLSGVWQGEGAPISELMKILPDGVNGLGEDPPPTASIDVLHGVKPEEHPLRPEFRAAYQKQAAVALTEPTPALGSLS
jgi:hypothetical protein